MELGYLKELLSMNESQILEFKNYKTKLNSDIFETVCSFVNRDGGILIIGYDEKNKEIVGIDDQYIDQIQKDFTNGCSNPEIITPKLSISLNKIKIDGKNLLYTSVYPSSQVHKLNDKKILDRQHDADIDITKNSELISKMYLRKSGIYTEDAVYPYCRLEDLRSDVIDTARKLASIKNSKHPWKNMSDLELLKSAGLYVSDALTGKTGITLAGILLFGKDEIIKNACPNHRTDCIKRVKNLDRYDDRDDIRTNLIDTYFRMLKFIEKHLDSGFALAEDTTRYHPRDFLFREPICNIIMHREYRDRTVASMVIEKDKVVFTNGSISKHNGKITLENFKPISKNPRIAEVFNNMGLADELGSGIRNMYKYNRIYSNSIPTVIEGDVFITIIPLESPEVTTAVNESQEEKIINYIKKYGQITSKEIRNILEIERTRTKDIINKLIKIEKIERKGTGVNTYYILK